MNNKKGSVSIFLTMILLSFIFVIGVFTEAAAGKASRAYANSIIDLAGRSVLSEYNSRLKERYGIFGISTDEEETKYKINNYLRSSFSKRKGKMDLFRLKVKDTKVDLSSYPLTNLQGFDEQIQAYMQGRVILEGITAFDLLQKERSIDEYLGSDEKKDAIKQDERILKNKRVLNGLPSRQLKDQCKILPDLTGLFELDELKKVAVDSIYMNLYILKKFQQRLGALENYDCFFKNEIEYVLCGRMNDSDNANMVKASLLALRTSMNVAHIYADIAKMEAVTAAASLISPGVGAVGTQIIIVGTWAAAEALNDVKRIEKGGRVPLYKTADDWVIGLESVIKEQAKPVGLSNNSERGLNYENYLFILLCFMNKETKLIRTMDLIQINMKANCQEDFLLSRCYWGVDLECTLERESGFFLMKGTRVGKFVSNHVY